MHNISVHREIRSCDEFNAGVTLRYSEVIKMLLFFSRRLNISLDKQVLSHHFSVTLLLHLNSGRVRPHDEGPLCFPVKKKGRLRVISRLISTLKSLGEKNR